MIAGVAGGLGRYFELDPTLFRVLFVLFVFTDGLGIILYLLLWIMMPPSKALQKSKAVRTKKKRKARMILGAILIIVGVTALLDFFFPLAIFEWRIFWSIVILGVGFWLFTKNSATS